jgi:rhodanese-related sulfurtransferase
VNIPLNSLTDPASMSPIDDNDNFLYVHCASGYRSIIAASLLKHHGIHNLRNINGGYEALRNVDRIEIEKSTEVLN